MVPLFYLVVLALLAPKAFCQGNSTSPEDKQKCLKDLLRWCQNQEYNNDTGIAITAMSTFLNGEFFSFACVSSAQGTECSKNDSPWFECFPNKTLTYEGKQMDENSPVDDDICEAKNVSRNIVIDSKAVREEIEQLDEELSHELRQLRESLRRIFGNGFPFSSEEELDGDGGDADP